MLGLTVLKLFILISFFLLQYSSLVYFWLNGYSIKADTVIGNIITWLFCAYAPVTLDVLASVCLTFGNILKRWVIVKLL